VDPQHAWIERHAVVPECSCATREHAVNHIAAYMGSVVVTGAGVSDSQVFAVDSGCDRAAQVRGQVGCGAVRLAVVADCQRDGSPVDGQGAWVQREGVVGEQSGAVGERAGDRVRPDVRGGVITGAAVVDGQVLAVDPGGDCGTQVGGQVGRAAVGLRVVPDA